MYDLQSIKITNFFSHKETSYSFENGKCVMVYGINNADTGADSNGSGKTTLLEGISLALTGEVCKEVDKEDFINEDADSCKVVLSLNSKHLKHKFSIEREFFRGSKSSKIKLIEDGVENTKITSVAEANKRIYEFIGISRDDLLHYFIIGQATNHSFFDSPDSEKKDMIGRLTNITLLSPVLKSIESKKSELEVKVSNNDLIIEQKEDRVLELQNDLKENRATFKSLISDKLDSINTKRKNIEISKETNTSKIKELSASINTERIRLENEKKKLVQETITKHFISKYETELSQLTKEKKEAEKIETELNNELHSILNCPLCKGDFIPHSEHSPESVKDMIEEISLVKNDLIKQISLKEKEIVDNNKLIADNVIVSANIRSYERTLHSLSETREEKIQKDLDLIDDLKQLQEDEKALNEELSGNKELKKILEGIKKIKDEISVLVSSNKTLKPELDNYIFWHYHMGKKGFSTFLANKAIKIIEGVTNSNLKRFDTNVSVLINGFTTLKSGDIREKIDVFIQRNGKNRGKYGKYSGGEKGRINVAGILGLQKLINQSTNGRGLNFLALDEIFEGLDKTGQSQVIPILEKTGITTMVITHMNNFIACENELFIVKDEKGSYIFEN